MLDLRELLKDWPCIVTEELCRTPIRGITEHSKRVQPGYLFIARKGGCADGLSFIEEAIQHGAAAVVLDRALPKKQSFQVPVITVPDCLSFLAYASAKLAGNPAERLTIIAVTGTNGKTTVTHFIGQMLKEADIKAAVIGTVGVWIDGVYEPIQLPSLTTLTAEHLHPLLKQCEAQGVTHIVMEASSMGLATARLKYCPIDVGVLLNISEDHYEEHGSKEAYLQAKQELFSLARTMIVNHDDSVCLAMIDKQKEDILTFGRSNQGQFQLIQNGENYAIQTDTKLTELTGGPVEEFNRLNLLAAMSVLSVLEIKEARYENALRTLKLPEGRMQRIENNGVTVIIDYAHTPDALKLVLQTTSVTTKGKLFVVFGCGGNRDKGKRSKMGEVAAHYATKVILTSDNPRSEDPMQIIEEIAAGIQTTAYEKIIDRKKAIYYAFSLANVGDMIVIAGKGHEKTQEIAGQLLPFSDQKIVEELFLPGRKQPPL